MEQAPYNTARQADPHPRGANKGQSMSKARKKPANKAAPSAPTSSVASTASAGSDSSPAVLPTAPAAASPSPPHLPSIAAPSPPPEPAPAASEVLPDNAPSQQPPEQETGSQAAASGTAGGLGWGGWNSNSGGAAGWGLGAISSKLQQVNPLIFCSAGTGIGQLSELQDQGLAAAMAHTFKACLCEACCYCCGLGLQCMQRCLYPVHSGW